jgi:hypothetical protein
MPLSPASAGSAHRSAPLDHTPDYPKEALNAAHNLDGAPRRPECEAMRSAQRSARDASSAQHVGGGRHEHQLRSALSHGVATRQVGPRTVVLQVKHSAKRDARSKECPVAGLGIWSRSSRRSTRGEGRSQDHPHIAVRGSLIDLARPVALLKSTVACIAARRRQPRSGPLSDRPAEDAEEHPSLGGGATSAVVSTHRQEFAGRHLGRAARERPASGLRTVTPGSTNRVDPCVANLRRRHLEGLLGR